MLTAERRPMGSICWDHIQFTGLMESVYGMRIEYCISYL